MAAKISDFLQKNARIIDFFAKKICRIFLILLLPQSCARDIADADSATLDDCDLKRR